MPFQNGAVEGQACETKVKLICTKQTLQQITGLPDEVPNGEDAQNHFLESYYVSELVLLVDY